MNLVFSLEFVVVNQNLLRWVALRIIQHPLDNNDACGLE